MIKRLLPEFERRTDPVIPVREFVTRLIRTGIVALVLTGASLLAGILGYHFIAGLSWSDAFVNAAMLLGGMGPVNNPTDLAGKLFAGTYALYCGLIVILVTGILLAPLVHRMLHKFHMQDSSQ